MTKLIGMDKRLCVIAPDTGISFLLSHEPKLVGPLESSAVATLCRKSWFEIISQKMLVGNWLKNVTIEELKAHSYVLIHLSRIKLRDI